MKSSVGAFLLATASLCGPVACASRGGDHTAVAQGRQFRSGNPSYDRFFDATYALQLKVGAAPAEFADARQNLSDAVVVSKSTSSAALAERIKSELDRVGRQSSHVRVEFITPTSLDASATRVTLTPAAKPRSVDATLIRQIENSTTRLARLDVSMKLARQELSGLCNVALELESSLDKAFPEGSPRRSEVTANLRDAERMITLLQARAAQVESPTADFLSKFASEVGTPYRAPSTVEPSEQRVARSARSSGSARSGDAKPAEPTPRTVEATRPAPANAEPVTRADFDP
ncbi:MAG: hypothetical protein QM756_39460 [Polyangiaceae bacterium]